MNQGITGFATTALSVLTVSLSFASSHREAPLIARDPAHDNTDVYAFISPVSGDLVLAASWIPFQEPTAGGSYYEWADDVIYTIHVDNDGDAVADYSYEMTVETSVSDSDSAFYNLGPMASIDSANWNRRQRVTVTEVAGGDTTLVSNELIAPANIGSKSTPDYPSLFNAAVRVYNAGDTLRIFAGTTDDPFFADFQLFDLLTLRGQAPPIGYSSGNNQPQDSFAGFNVHSLVVELPVARVVDADPVLGVWATARRISDDSQLSRAGMPHFNLLLLGMGLKDTFNGLAPNADAGIYGVLQADVEDPELATLLCTLYGLPLPGDNDSDCHTEFDSKTPRSGRGDIFDLFMRGVELANEFSVETAGGPQVLPTGFNINRPQGVVPSEMLRINTSISGAVCAPSPSRLGLLGGDLCGFPNGRRLADDVLDITLLAMAGAFYEALDDRDASFNFNGALVPTLTDGIDHNDRAFSDTFPYLTLPQSGQEHRHFIDILIEDGFESAMHSLNWLLSAPTVN